MEQTASLSDYSSGAVPKNPFSFTSNSSRYRPLLVVTNSHPASAKHTLSKHELEARLEMLGVQAALANNLNSGGRLLAKSQNFSDGVEVFPAECSFRCPLCVFRGIKEAYFPNVI
jgi:hypothetical protein